MTAYHLTPDSGPDLRFDGEIIAEVSSERCGPHGEPLRGPPRDQWSELRIYRTAAGAYVAESRRVVRCADGQGDVDLWRAAVCDDERAVVAFFHRPGQAPSWFTKELLDLANIDHTEVVP